MQHARLLPVRVSRRGWRRAVHPTIDQLEDAVARAIEDMRTDKGILRFKTINGVQDFICARVRAELQVTIYSEFDADEVDASDVETGGQLLKVHTDRVGPIFVILDPAPVKPMTPVSRVGLAASQPPKGAA